jgi:hypothetical protein
MPAEKAAATLSDMTEVDPASDAFGEETRARLPKALAGKEGTKNRAKNRLKFGTHFTHIDTVRELAPAGRISAGRGSGDEREAPLSN